MNSNNKDTNEKVNKPCQHFWIIEPPGADNSLGICKYCGKQQMFANSYQYRSVDRSFKNRAPADAEAVST